MNCCFYTFIEYDQVVFGCCLCAVAFLRHPCAHCHTHATARLSPVRSPHPPGRLSSNPTTLGNSFLQTHFASLQFKDTCQTPLRSHSCCHLLGTLQFVSGLFDSHSLPTCNVHCSLPAPRTYVHTCTQARTQARTDASTHAHARTRTHSHRGLFLALSISVSVSFSLSQTNLIVFATFSCFVPLFSFSSFLNRGPMP